MFCIPPSFEEVYPMNKNGEEGNYLRDFIIDRVIPQLLNTSKEK